MKKTIAVLAAVSMAMSLAACGGSSASSSAPAPASSAPAAAPSSSAAASAPEAEAPAGGNSVEGKTVVFIPKLTGNAFFEAANDGAQKYAAEWGITVDYQGSPNAAVADQVQVINTAVASGADAICISTVDAAGVADALKAATDAGVAVATWDSDAQPSDRTLMVSQGTPEVLGRMLVDMACAGLEQRGKDPKSDEITYCWHYSQATVTDQNSWQVAGEAIIKAEYPNWTNVAPDNYYSEQDAEKAITIGEAVLSAHPEIDVIICNDSTALPGQLQAAENKGYNQENITITGFASPNAIKEYCSNGTLYNWGLWDCAVQGGMGCYLAAYMAAGNTVKVGDVISIPGIGDCEVLANDSIAEGASTADSNNGVVLMPETSVYTAENMNDYNF